jgi:hypothetical protein
MKRTVLILFALTVGCAAGREPPADERWIVGTWCSDGETRHAGVLVVLRPMRFRGDGTYSTFEDEGRWTFASGRLHLVGGAMTVHRTGRVERLGSDRMAWTDDHGEREVWRRCAARA